MATVQKCRSRYARSVLDRIVAFVVPGPALPVARREVVSIFVAAWASPREAARLAILPLIPPVAQRSELPGIQSSVPHDQLARALAQLPVAVALLAGPEHVYVAASGSYMRIAGKPVLGRRYRDVFPELAGQGFFEIVDEVYGTGRPWSGRATPAAWDADGDGVPEAHGIDVTFAPVRGENGEVEAITLTVEMVDERVAAERARESAIVEAEASAAWALRLQQVAAALNEAATPAEVAAVCVRHGMQALGAGSLGVLVGGNAEFEIVYSVGYPPDVEERWRSFPLWEGKPLSDAVLLRTPILLANPGEWEERYPNAASDLRHAGTVAFAATPIMVAGRVLAGLSFSYRDSKRFGPGERLFLATLGEQAAQAMERGPVSSNPSEQHAARPSGCRR